MPLLTDKYDITRPLAKKTPGSRLVTPRGVTTLFRGHRLGPRLLRLTRGGGEALPFSGKARDTFVRFRALHNKRLVEMSTPEQAGGFACGLDAGVLEHGRSKGQVKTPEQPPRTPGQTTRCSRRVHGP